MTEEQINKIKIMADKYATSFFPYEKQFLEREAVVKCCVKVVEEATKELQEELEEWKSEWQDQVQEAIDEGYARTQLQIENGKLKEQIEKMKRCEICKHYRWNHCSYEINISEDCIQNKLKHFELKEIKEK